MKILVQAIIAIGLSSAVQITWMGFGSTDASRDATLFGLMIFVLLKADENRP